VIHERQQPSQLFQRTRLCAATQANFNKGLQTAWYGMAGCGVAKKNDNFLLDKVVIEVSIFVGRSGIRGPPYNKNK